METKAKKRVLVMRSISMSITTFFLVVIASLHPQIAFADKSKQKQNKLQITTTSAGKGYLKNPVTLKYTGGSGSGRVTFSVQSGPCVYMSSAKTAPSGIGLYTTSTTPAVCSVVAKKAADKNYLEVSSKSLIVHFDYFPGYYKLLAVQALIPLELNNWKEPEGRISAPNSGGSFDGLLKASQASEVRFAPYWLTLNTFWNQRLIALNATDSYYNSKFEDFAFRGMSNSGAARLLGEKQLIQKNLKVIVKSQLTSTWSNYLRDMDSVYK